MMMEARPVPTRRLITMTPRFRWPAVLLAVATLAAACGSADDTSSGGGSSGESSLCDPSALESASGPIEIDMWYGFVGLAGQALEDMAADYNASQDKVTIRVSNQGSYDEQLQKFKTGLGRPESLPEIMTGEDTNTQLLVDSKSIVPAQDCIEADSEATDLFGDLVPAVKAFYSVDDRLLPGGFGISHPVLYFNKRIFEEAGITAAPTTLAELRTVSEQIKAAGIAGVDQPLVMKMDSWFFELFLTGDGKPVVNNDNGWSDRATEALLTSDPVTEQIAWLKGMIDDGLLKPIASNDDISPYLAVATESGAMLIQTSAAITTIDAAIKGTLSAEIVPELGDLDVSGFKFDTLRVGVAPIPGISEAGRGQISGNAWYMLRKSPEEVAAAWDFLKFANSTEAQVKWTSSGGYLPAHERVAADPTLVAAFEADDKGQWLKTAYGAILTLDPEYPGPRMGAYAAFRSEARGALDQIALEGADPSTVLAKANATINEAFAAYNANPGQ
jgi:sn-glycerol 3-phosphate transport system substrate-binding protein